MSECETLTTLTVVLLEEHVVGEEGHAHERGLVLHGSSVLVVEAELVAVRAHLLAALSDARRGELSEEAHVAVGLLGHGTEAALEAELGAAAEAEGASYGEQVVAKPVPRRICIWPRYLVRPHLRLWRFCCSRCARERC